MSYQIEYLALAGLLGTFVMLIIAPFAMLALAVVLVAVAAAVVALVAGIVAAPFLAFRAAHRRIASRRAERRHEHLADERAYPGSAHLRSAS